MKKTLLFLCAAFMTVLASAQSTCHRDSSLLNSTAIVSPYPWTPDSPYYNLHPACIDDPYNQSVTIKIPDSISVPSFPVPFAISSISMNTSGAIAGLPVGLTYSCDPPNCVFLKHTLGCVLLYGTPTSANTPVPDTTELKLTVSVASPSFPFPIPVQFPGSVAPNNHFYLIVKAHGQCVSGTNDLANKLFSLQTIPNPFSDRTTISVESAVDGMFTFEVFNLFGQHVYSDKIKLVTGENKFTFDAGDLPNGAYIYSIGNREGKITRKMVIAR